MRSFFTKLFFALLVTFFATSAMEAQVYIWGGPGDANSEFDGGLNEWTTNDDRGATWVWTEDGTGSDGCYWGTRGPIESPSVANGAALFNSDKFDCMDGIAYPHRGELTSPVFSCEGHSTVFVKFDQITRYWNASSNETYMQVSTDGGTTWLPGDGINCNPDLLRWNFEAWERENQKLFDISEYAANQPNVQIRFVWNGAYYYWIIDDVYVIEQPDVDLEISAILYDPIASQFPASQADARDMGFAINLPNHGSVDAENVTVGVTVSDADGNVVYEDAINEITATAGDTTEVDFENSFLASEGQLEGGTYYIDYYTTADGVTEMNMADNGWGDRFFVSESYYDNHYYTPFNAWGLENYAAFNIFETGSWSEADYPNYTFLADSINMACSDGNDEETFLADVNIFIYKVSDDVAADFSNFDTEAPAQLDPGEDPHPQLELIGFGFESSYQNDDYTAFRIGLYNLDFEENVVLEPNTRYIVMAYWNNDKSLYHVADRLKFHNGLPASGWWAPFGDNDEWVWDFDPWYGWLIGMDINYVVNANTVQLPENTMEAFPVPADTDLNIDINFEEMQDEATIVLTDINNRYVQSIKIENFNTSSETMNVSNIPSGNYILRLLTKEGVAEQKIVIQH
jgi:hypothetical protein